MKWKEGNMETLIDLLKTKKRKKEHREIKFKKWKAQNKIIELKSKIEIKMIK